MPSFQVSESPQKLSSAVPAPSKKVSWYLHLWHSFKPIFQVPEVSKKTQTETQVEKCPTCHFPFDGKEVETLCPKCFKRVHSDCFKADGCQFCS